jgi:hypothetical protein
MPGSYTQTKTVDAVYTRFAENYVGNPEYRDNFYRDRPLLHALREKARVMTSGGQNLKHRINMGTTANGGSLARNQTFSIQGNLNQTASTWTWSVLFETCFVSWWDVMETENSPAAVQSIVESQLKETDENLQGTILGQLTQTSKASASDLNTLIEIVASTGATGGMNPSTAGQETWAAQVEDTINVNVEFVGRARELKTSVKKAKGEPGLIVLPSGFRDELCEVGDATQVSNVDMKTKGGTLWSTLGSDLAEVVGLPVVCDHVWDTNQAAQGLMLDLSAIHLVENSRWSMFMYPFKEMAHHGRLGQATVKLYVAQLTASSRRAQGRFSTLS